MVLLVRYLAVISAVTIAISTKVTPVEKVIGLLEDMKTDIEAEAVAEAETYGKFACFCKDTTVKKSTSITEGQDNIDKLSATIADDTAEKTAEESKLQGLKAKKEELTSELEATTARCAKEKAEYEATAADLNKALSSLKAATKAMKSKKDAIASYSAASASALFQVDTGLKDTLDLADALGLIKAPKQKAFLQGFSTSFLQETDSKAPVGEYSYHSSDIVELLESLDKDFTSQKQTLDTEYGKTEKACTETKAALNGKLDTNKQDTDTASEKINFLGESVSTARGNLVEAQDLLKDDEQYIKDLTVRCEARATDWDQRSQMRAKEIEAISTALTVLGDKVQPADKEVNARVLLQNPEKKASSEQPVPKATSEPKKASTKAAPSFLQRAADVSEHSSKEAQEQRLKDDAVTAIKAAGLRLKSPVLTALAMRVAADPFKKVKNLIQGLIERLIKEAAAEATKKGFCDTELGKARKDRGFRWERVNKLQAEIQVLQAKEDELNEEIKSLTSSLESLDQALKSTEITRKEEKDENLKTIRTADEGLKAVNEALLILRSFYKEAAKAALLQTAASPVDEDSPGAGFSGTYQGKQQSSNAVLALLETIASDFQRTVRSTEASEETAAKLYVKFVQTTKAEIAGKTTKKELDEQDLKTTSNKLEVDRADMKTNMNLVDDAVKTLMELKPTCIDTGMSYADRVAKREEEIEALNKALCILDTEGVEKGCKLG